MFCLKDNPTSLAEQASTSHKKVEKFPKTPTIIQDPFNMNDMKKVLQKMSNEMLDLKKNNNENQPNNRGFVRFPFT